MVTLFQTAGIGALLFLDATAVGHFLISAPIVTAPLIGWFLGDITLGLIIGAYLELIWIGLLPVGSRIPPNANVVAVVATASLIMGGANISGGIISPILVWGVFYGVFCGIVAREMKVSLYFLHSHFGHLCDRAAHKGTLARVEGIALSAILLDWIMMFLFLSIAIWSGKMIIGYLTALNWSAFEISSRIALDAFILVGLAVVLDLFSRKTEYWLPLVVSAVAGLVFLSFMKIISAVFILLVLLALCVTTYIAAQMRWRRD
jgi:mannose PTS system EIID component